LPVDIRGCYPWLRTATGPSPRDHSNPEHAHELHAILSGQTFSMLATDVMRGLCRYLLCCREHLRSVFLLRVTRGIPSPGVSSGMGRCGLEPLGIRRWREIRFLWPPLHPVRVINGCVGY